MALPAFWRGPLRSPGGAAGARDGALLLLLAALATGLGLVVAAGAHYYWPLGVLAGLAVCLALPLLLKPQWASAGLVLALLMVDEFPNGLGETVERSLRTPFYSTSLGLPGLYPPDLLLLLALGLLVVHALVLRRPLGLRVDAVAVVVVSLVLCVLVAIVASVLDGNPLAPVEIEVSTGVGFDVNQRGLQYIGAFQFKIFLMLPAAYLLGRLLLREPGALERMRTWFALGIAGNLLAGVVRLALNPDLPRSGNPLFYDSPATWIFALCIFHTLALWAWGALDRRQALLRGLVCAVLLLFILVSFRRTMWAACALATLLLVLMLPGRARARLLMAGVGLAAVLGALVLLTPLQDQVLAPALARVGQTTVEDTSTLYRLAIFVYMAENLTDIPLFGYGLQPLWNKIAALGYFRINIEGIHSLYFWWFLRTGWFGITVALFGAVAVAVMSWRTFRRAREPHQKALALCLVLAWLILAVSGVFNPVYGQVRYMVLTGLGLAVLSHLRARPEPAPEPASAA